MAGNKSSLSILPILIIEQMDEYAENLKITNHIIDSMRWQFGA